MRWLVALLLVVGCHHPRPAGTPMRARIDVPVVVEENAPSLDDARRRVRRHLKAIGIRSGPKCVCEPMAGGAMICSLYR